MDPRNDDPPATPATTDRHFRRQPRAGHRTTVRYRPLDAQDGEPRAASQAATLNIGTGGAFILSDDPAPPGTRLLVEVDLPDGRAVTLPAEVRWVAGGEGEDARGMGVRFGDVDAEIQVALDEHFGHTTATLDHDEG